MPMLQKDRTGAAAPLCDRMEHLARRVERLSVSRHDPEAFFEERSEIVARLREEATRASGLGD